MRAGLAALALLASASAHATGGQWDTPAAGHNGNGANSTTPWVSSPSVDSVVAEWNFFNAVTDLLPDVAGAGTVAETNGVAFVTSGGNIYSFSGATAFTATLGASLTGNWDVYLRTATLGTSPVSTATLNGLSAERTVTFTEALTGGFGGGEEESLWQWTAVPGASTFTFNFSALGSSMSLDQLALYATPSAVPEPTTWALMGAGIGLLAMRRRQLTRNT